MQISQARSMEMKLSAEDGSPGGQFAIACVAGKGIGLPSTDLFTAFSDHPDLDRLSRAGALNKSFSVGSLASLALR
jgi:hypothetical protein